MDTEAMSGLRDSSVYLGFSGHGHNANEMRFQRTKPSADSEERSVSAGSRHLHRSPGQDDTKVVCQDQMDSYHARFCETVEMGLPGRVIDLDVVGLEHEADDEKEERARYETEVE